MKISISKLAMVLVLYGSVSAFGQTDSPDSTAYRKWDATGSLGLLFTNQREFLRNTTDDYTADTSATVGSIGVGRYLTTHLKTDAGITWTAKMGTREWSPPENRGAVFVDRQVWTKSFSGVLTYQFFENVFAHPYISAGLRVNDVNEHQQALTSSPVPGPTPTCSAMCSVNTTTTTTQSFVQVRPFVAGGFKSYFNQRVFIKSEGLVAASPHGFGHVTVHFGLGFDF